MTSLVAGDATDMVPLPRSDGAKASLAKQLVAPAEVLADGQTVYNLYRGVICVCKNDVLARIWVDMSHMEVCVAKLDSSFIARFKVEDLVVRKTRSLLLVDSQKSPEVSPEDAPIDVAEIELEEESDTSYSLVFWASPEADAKDDAQSLKASGESNAPGRRRDELTVPGRPRLDNNGVERPTVVLHLRPPDQQYLSSDVLEEQMPGSRSGSKRRSEQSGGSSSSSSSTWRREGQRSAKTRPGGTGSSQLSSIREQSRESSRAEKKGSPQEEKEEAAGTSTDREERKDGLSNPQTTNYISAEQKAKPREQEAELSGTALHASTTNITTSLSTSALEESTPVLGSSSGVTTSLGGSVAVRPSQGDVELLPDHTESGTATPTAKNGGPGTGGPQAGRAFLNNMLDDDVCSSSTAAVPNLHTFLNNIRKLRGLVDTDAHAILHLQRNMFQYLWRFNAAAMTPDQLFSAQAVLAFNLDPKDGIAYLKDKVLRSNDVEPRRIGEWIAEMSAAGKGGIDPSILGRFFSRKDSLDIYTGFVDALDFSGLTITQAMRKLFDCFKPGGEGQVIDRIIKLFSDSYYQQVVTNYKKQRLAPRDPNEFPDWTSAESPYSFGFAIIMLNTDLHVMSKIMKKAGGGGKGEGSASMSLQQFIANTRCVLPAEEVSDAFLSHVYADIARAEIQLRPLPQAPLSSLPVAPDIEGWLTVVLPHGAQGVAIQRYWCVLAIQRLYIFSDRYHGLGLYPRMCLDVKAIRCGSVSDSEGFQNVLAEILQNQLGSSRGRSRSASCGLAKCFPAGCPSSGSRDRSSRQQLVSSFAEYKLYAQDGFFSHDLAIVIKPHGKQQDNNLLDLYYRPTVDEEKGILEPASNWARRASLMVSARSVSSHQPDGSWELRYPRQRIFVCCAETPNLMNKWVSMLSM